MGKPPVRLALLALLCGPVFAQIAQVRHAPSLNGTVEGSVQQMTAEDTTLNGGAVVTGDLLVPGTPTVRLNGHPTYGGTLDGTGSATPSTHKITLNGSAKLGHVIRRTDAVALPTVAAPPLPTGTRSVSLNSSGQSPGDFATLKSLTLNGAAGPIAVPPGTYGEFTANGSSSFVLGVAGATAPAVYNFRHLTLNGSSRLDVVGPVIVTLVEDVSANGSLGNSAHPAWLTLRLAGGSLTLNGRVSLHGYVTAPSGKVTLNGNAQLVGGLIADQLTLNGNSLLRLLAPPLPFLANFEPTEGYQPGPLHGQRGWSVTGAASVVASPVYAGQQAVSVAPATPPALLTRAFANDDPGVTFVDLFARPAAAATANAGVFFDTDAASVALTGTAPTGILQAFNGDGAGAGTWFPTGTGPALDATGRATDWLRLTLRSDYAGKKWDLYFNGRMIAADLGFINNAPAAFTGLGLSGHASLATSFDDLLVAFDNPLFVDADHDGMDDAWETAHGLNPALNDRDADPDQDGLTNVQEYLLGTNPQSADTDGDGLPDGWEEGHGFDPLVATDGGADADGDGVNNLQEYLNGTDPTDYYNGQPPVVTSLLPPDGSLVDGTHLAFRVTDTAGTPLVNGPVTLTARGSEHALSPTLGDRWTKARRRLEVRSDNDGIVRAYVVRTDELLEPLP